MNAMLKKRVDEVELKLIEEFFRDAGRVMGHFTDAELQRIIDLSPRCETSQATDAEVAEYQELIAKELPSNFDIMVVAHLVEDVGKALDRLEAAGIYPWHR